MTITTDIDNKPAPVGTPEQGYTVHIFPIMHVKILGISASSQTEAMEKAEAMIWDNYRAFERVSFGDVEYAELADGEEPSHFLVDEVGDDEFQNSKWYNGDKSPMIGNETTNQQRIAELKAALQAVIKWLDFAAAKLGDVDDLDRNIKKYGARKWVKQFGEGAGHRANDARTVLNRKEEE